MVFLDTINVIFETKLETWRDITTDSFLTVSEMEYYGVFGHY